MAAGDPVVITAPAADDGNDIQMRETTAGNAQAVVIVDPTTGDPVALGPGPWTAIPLGDWNVGDGNAAVYRHGDRVWFAAGAYASDDEPPSLPSTIGTLPAGHRPTAMLVIDAPAVNDWDGTREGCTAICAVDTTGEWVFGGLVDAERNAVTAAGQVRLFVPGTLSFRRTAP
jgi:hypothetical protein